MLGVLAVDVLHTKEHVPAVRVLIHHRERTIAQAALSVASRI